MHICDSLDIKYNDEKNFILRHIFAFSLLGLTLMQPTQTTVQKKHSKVL